MREFLGDYDSLMKGFSRFRAAALRLRTPNDEDDDVIKMAIVGFSMNAPTEAWSRRHFEFVRQHCDGEFDERTLSVLHGLQAHNFGLFAGLCLGYLLGLAHIGSISNDELGVGAAQLAGFMTGAAGTRL